MAPLLPIECMDIPRDTGTTTTSDTD